MTKKFKFTLASATFALALVLGTAATPKAADAFFPTATHVGFNNRPFVNRPFFSPFHRPVGFGVHPFAFRPHVSPFGFQAHPGFRTHFGF